MANLPRKLFLPRHPIGHERLEFAEMVVTLVLGFALAEKSNHVDLYTTVAPQIGVATPVAIEM